MAGFLPPYPGGHQPWPVTPIPHSGNLQWGQQCPWFARAECGPEVSHLPWVTARCAFNPPTVLVSDPWCHRRVLPHSTRMPEEATAVTWRRKNTASSCQNTQSAVTTASPPDTGTRNYRCLRIGSAVPWCRHLGATLLQSHGWFCPANTHRGDARGTQAPASSWGAQGTTHRFRAVKALFVGLGLGEFVAFAQN